MRVYLRSPGLDAYRPDLELLLARLRAEAGLDIAETRDPAQAQIVIEAVPAAQITRIFPTAACFIVPGETDWRGFLRRRPEDRLRWPDQATLERAAIFLPLDTTPQDVRDCLNEEITQALGPADDLYRLPDTIWNDDNFHGMATPFDMLILRDALPARAPERHDPRRGRRRAAERARPHQPEGPRPAAASRAQPESPAWNEAIETALSRDAPRARTARRGDRRHPDRRRDAAGRPPARRRAPDLGPAPPAPRPGGGGAGLRPRLRAVPRAFGVEDVRTAQAGVHLAALAVGTGQYGLAIEPRRPPPAGGARRAERHPRRRAPVDQGRGAGRLRARPRRRRPPASTRCAGRAMASATPTGRWPASRRRSPR